MFLRFKTRRSTVSVLGNGEVPPQTSYDLQFGSPIKWAPARPRGAYMEMLAGGVGPRGGLCAQVPHSTCPPLSSSPTREQLCNRSCSNKHTLRTYFQEQAAIQSFTVTKSRSQWNRVCGCVCVCVWSHACDNSYTRCTSTTSDRTYAGCDGGGAAQSHTSHNGAEHGSVTIPVFR